ncbi:YlxR family protein [Nesterenkonia sp. HG001]|nr:YlxR family protein [Nesterenkonia sp. HG001]MDZ5076123.1 YlxR family protein [Nesterenkonia sp. HG001]
MVPVRTCVGCRRRVEQGDVVRLALAPEAVEPDADRSSGRREVVSQPCRVVVDAVCRMPGRGAWIHPRPECFEAAVRRKAFNRAFRRPVSIESLSFEHVEAAAVRPWRRG